MGFHHNHGYFYDFRVLMDWHLFSLIFFSRQGWNKRKSIDTQLHSITMFSQRTTLINRTDTRLIRTTEQRTNHITNVFKLISTKVTIKNNSSIDYDLSKVYVLKSVSKTLSVTRRQLAFKHYHHLLKLFSSYYVCASDKYYIFFRFELPDKSFPIDISFLLRYPVWQSWAVQWPHNDFGMDRKTFTCWCVELIKVLWNENESWTQQKVI